MIISGDDFGAENVAEVGEKFVELGIVEISR